MENVYQTWSPRVLALLRIATALLFLQHATAKLFAFPHVAQFDNLQIASLLGVAGLIEIVGGLLVLLGLFTRSAAFILSGLMAVAYFLAHPPQPFFPPPNQPQLPPLHTFPFPSLPP